MGVDKKYKTLVWNSGFHKKGDKSFKFILCQLPTYLCKRWPYFTFRVRCHRDANSLCIYELPYLKKVYQKFNKHYELK